MAGVKRSLPGKGANSLRLTRTTRARPDLRILLLQIREDHRVRAEEHASFRDYSGLDASQIEVINAFERAEFPPDVADDYDALFIGGASEASVLEPERYPFVGPCIKLVRRCVRSALPVFASCFGFQLAVLALGGRLVRDQRDFEVGTIPIRLTAHAGGDPLFCDVPDGFLAVSVHRERATETPAGCQVLAYTDKCIHSFRVEGRPFWAFQFHPEVNRARLVERLTIYKSQYTDDDAHLERVLSAAAETPESNRLVEKFVERVLIGRCPGPGGLVRISPAEI
jgi:GMP synthase (glutamine-hydrolysing)